MEELAITLWYYGFVLENEKAKGGFQLIELIHDPIKIATLFQINNRSKN